MQAAEVVAERRHVQAEDLDLVPFGERIAAASFPSSAVDTSEVDHILRDRSDIPFSRPAERVQIVVTDVAGRRIRVTERGLIEWRKW